MKSPRQRQQVYAMAFPRSVDASLVENARPAKHYLSHAKTQREKQNRKICLCPKQSLSQKKIPGKDPEKSRIETNSANALPPLYSYTLAWVEKDSSETAVSLPYWINFETGSWTFKFFSDKSSDTGEYKVTVKGEDAGIISRC